jgi:hypothetical protein
MTINESAGADYLTKHCCLSLWGELEIGFRINSGLYSLEPIEHLRALMPAGSRLYLECSITHIWARSDRVIFCQPRATNVHFGDWMARAN